MSFFFISTYSMLSYSTPFYSSCSVVTSYFIPNHPILLIKSITDLVDTFHSDNMNLLRILDDKFLRTVMTGINGDIVSLP